MVLATTRGTGVGLGSRMGVESGLGGTGPGLSIEKGPHLEKGQGYSVNRHWPSPSCRSAKRCSKEDSFEPKGPLPRKWVTRTVTNTVSFTVAVFSRVTRASLRPLLTRTSPAANFSTAQSSCRSFERKLYASSRFSSSVAVRNDCTAASGVPSGRVSSLSSNATMTLATSSTPRKTPPPISQALLIDSPAGCLYALAPRYPVSHQRKKLCIRTSPQSVVG